MDNLLYEIEQTDETAQDGSVILYRTAQGLQVKLEARPMGQDWNVSITGGEKPHIGAAALGTPYKKPDGTWSACASVLALPTHKEDALVRQAAILLAKRARHTVLVSCGIHTDNLTPEQIGIFVALTQAGMEALADMLEAKER